jgi:hypothetical protein
MKSRILTLMTLFGVLAIPARPAAQGSQRQKSSQHHHYKLIDIGTFGGPGSAFAETQHDFTRSGNLVGWADTTVSDPLGLAASAQQMK